MATRRRIALSGQNLLVNGGMELQTRKSASFSTTNTPTLDGWWLTLQGTAPVVVSRVASPFAYGGNALQAVYTGGAAGSAELNQCVENGQALAGQRLTLAATVKSSVPDTVLIYLYDGTSVRQSAPNATTSAERLAVSMTIKASPLYVYAALLIHTASCTAHFDDVTLTVGNEPLPYEPPHPADEARRAERQCVLQGGTLGSLLCQQHSVAAQWIVRNINFATPLLATPTVTKVGTWGVNNVTQPLIDSPTVSHYRSLANLIATGAAWFHCSDATTYMLAEAKP